MKRTSLIVLCFLTLSANCWIGCEDEDLTNYAVALSVSGTITDSVSGIALESVAIAFDDSTIADSYSDSAGFYTHITGGRTSAVVYA